MSRKNTKIIVCKTNEEDDDDEEEVNEVNVIDNDIYFYTEVTKQSILQLTLAIKKLTKDIKINAIKQNSSLSDINLYINSNGGDVHAALSVLDLIENNQVKINTIISGTCMSAATLISLMGHHRYITPNSYMLIHNMSSSFWGKMHEFEDEMKNMHKLTEHLKGIYLSYGTIKKSQLDGLLKKDVLLEPDLCLKYGFVDEINIV